MSETTSGGGPYGNLGECFACLSYEGHRPGCIYGRRPDHFDNHYGDSAYVFRRLLEKPGRREPTPKRTT